MLAAFTLVKIRFEDPGFEACFQQRKTTCFLSIRKSLACARASKLTKTCISPGVKGNQHSGRVGWMLADHRDGQLSSNFFSLILNGSVGLSVGIQTGGDSVPTCLLSKKSLACARASKLTKTCISPEPGAKANRWWGWMGWMFADHRDGLLRSRVFSLIPYSSVGLSAGIQSGGDWVPETLMYLAEEDSFPVPNHRR